MASTATTADPPEDRYAQTMRIAGHLAAFKNIETIPLPAMIELVQQMDILRNTSMLQEPGSPYDGMSVRLPSGVGKSTAARTLVRSAAERMGTTKDKGPVLLVTLDVEETISLWSAILRSLGDPYWDVGYPKNLKKRAIKLLARRQIGMIIVDEFNHSVDRGQARLLMNTVKEILYSAIAPVVVMGTDEEIEKLPKIPGFERRMGHAPKLGPLEWGSADDEQNWRGFLQGLDRGIVDAGILSAPSGLGSKKLAEALCEACDGVIGYAHWVVQDALTEVLKRSATSIEIVDLAISVNRLFVKFELYGRVNAVEGL